MFLGFMRYGMIQIWEKIVLRVFWMDGYLKIIILAVFWWLVDVKDGWVRQS